MLVIPQGVLVVGRTRSFHISCALAVWIQEFAPYFERWKCSLPFVHSVAGENWTDVATLPLRTSQTVAHITFPEGRGRSLRQTVRESGDRLRARGLPRLCGALNGGSPSHLG